MIVPTDEMEQAMLYGGATRERLTAVLEIAEQELRAQIAYRIRAELVCCDLFERTRNTPAWEEASEGPHAICYWSEAAARIAEEGEG